MPKSPITTAIIGDNGFTTRRLPISATIPKGFAPIGNRPVVDYVVDELVKAGVTDIYFVIHPYHRDLYERYFLGNELLDRHLESKGKDAERQLLKAMRGRATFHFISRVERYGTAIPPQLVFSEIGRFQECIFMASDDFTLRTDGGSDLADLLEIYDKRGAAGGLLGLELPMETLSDFGVMQVEAEAGTLLLKNMVEKPQHPENMSGKLLANIGKHIIGVPMEPYFKQVKPHPESGEYLIVDVYDAVAKDLEVVVQPATGKYYDVGTMENWLAANEALATKEID